MIDDLKPYPEYMDSSLPWLGRIPKHWDCLPHRAIFEEVKEQGHIDEQLLSVTIGKGVIRQEDLLAESSKKDSSNLDKSKYKLVEPGDIAYNKMRAWQGAVGVSRYRGMVSPAYIVQRLRGESRPDYFHHLFRTPGFTKEAERWSYGITSDQWSLRPQHFKMIYSCVPPLDEQELIVGFLRDFDRQVRRFIRNRRRLIEVLNEQRRSIIRALATQGTRTGVEMQNTALDQFPILPTHWEESRVKREFTNLDHKRIPLSTTVRGEMATREYDYYGASGVIDRVEGYIFDDELLLIAEDGANLVLRNLPLAIIARGKFWVNNHAHILKPKRGNIEYFAHVLELVDYRPWVTGAAQPKLTRERMMRVGIPAPPVEEQGEIVAAINNETGTLTEGIAKAKREIDLIREYRTRLIADVVTGKADVRHLAPTPGSEDLEEMVDELEPLDGAAGELDQEALAGEEVHADD
ncbi:MAG: hypothetical protein FKY71_12440 [Spiribacter salinus]|uniref:Type I restriction modification DNA specificity domain-containing protein n=1 Tax=Spiribacter salinus TaxID=1335746 RepID=A0A540VPM3_9GAMM|nr:MAG: hypothetical protein FKY71_12440 [Spiribacter salinus]